MAEYRQVADEVEKLFCEVWDNTAIPHWVEFKIMADDKLKKVVDVRKQNELVEYLTEGTHIAVLINEDIFDGLEEEYQKKAIEEEIARITVVENKIKVQQYDFTTNSDFLEKYGADDVILLHLQIISLYEQKKEKEEEEKERLKAEKKKK